MFNAEQFLKDYGITIPTDQTNTQPGWINIACPFCHDSSNHGGFNIEKEFYNCWKCGWYPLNDVIQLLTRSDNREARRIKKKYSRDIIPEEKEEIVKPCNYTYLLE